MSEQKPREHAPFKHLGTHLKYLREQSRESLAEASGAVEIDAEVLRRIEDGVERPPEDILLLLIQHYNMQDQEAVQLWELAGYDREESPHRLRLDDLANGANGKQLIMLLAMDMRTMYSDGVDITVSPGGMTFSFTQSGNKGQQMVVGRVGMSHEQAAQVLKTLEQALLKARYLNGPRGLPAPKDRPETE